MKDNTWIRLHAALMLAALTALGVAGLWWPMLGVSLITFSWLVAAHAPALRRLRPFGGYANWVTLARWILLLYAAYSYPQWPDYIVFLLFLMVIISDGIDGYLARRYQQSTKVGGLLDVETDALMSALLAGIHYQECIVGWWVLLAGGMRYGYVWLLYLLGWENHTGTDNPNARWIGATFISVLMGPFVAPAWLSVPALMIGSLLVTYSFGHSLWGKRKS